MPAGAPDPTRPAPHSFPIQLPLPVWILMAVVVFVFFAILQWDPLPRYRERAARREIERVGGRIETRPREPSLKDAGALVEVALNDSQATNGTLAYLAKLPKVNALLPDNTAVSDEGLAHLAALTRLEHLRLTNTRVTDAGLKH